MQHPLENPSLAPCGFVFPYYRQRLKFRPEDVKHFFNREKAIAKIWDRLNRTDAQKPTPVQTIVHEILPAQASVNRITKGDFCFGDLPYLTRDILVLSTAIQWFGTNCGNCFIETDISRHSGFHPEREFLTKFAQEKHYGKGLIAMWVHVCTSHCEKSQSVFWGGLYLPL